MEFEPGKRKLQQRGSRFRSRQRAKAMTVALGVAMTITLGLLSLVSSTTVGAENAAGHVTRHLRSLLLDQKAREYGTARDQIPQGAAMEATARRTVTFSPGGPSVGGAAMEALAKPVLRKADAETSMRTSTTSTTTESHGRGGVAMEALVKPVKTPDEDVLQELLERLVHDLKTKSTLCRVVDYPGVELDELNHHVKKLYPLVNPAFGEQPAFFIDQKHFIPYRIVADGTCEMAPVIGTLVGQWATWSGKRGTVALSAGAFVMDHSGKFAVRWPDVAYTPRKDDRKLAPNQVWIYRGEPFVPTFVVEFEKLSGEGSRLSVLDSKMRNEYFQHGVQLGWLIDPRPDCQKMYEYYLDEHGQVQCSDDTTWRNLDGRDVLPGFTLLCVDLEMALSLDPGSMSEEEEDLVCPFPRCRQVFRTRGAIAAHIEWHHAERAEQKYLAKQNSKLSVLNQSTPST